MQKNAGNIKKSCEILFLETKSRAKKCTSAEKVSNMERELFNDLLKWKDAANRKPLIIKPMGKQHTLTSKARNR